VKSRHFCTTFSRGNRSRRLSRAPKGQRPATEWDIDEDILNTLNLDLLYKDEMALTQAAIDTLQIAGQNNTDALVTGMRTLAAQRKLENIPIFQVKVIFL
jgi:hypothetical protein